MDKKKKNGDVESQTEITEGTEKFEVQEKRILIRIPVRHNPKLQKIVDHINQDDELYTLWQVMNVNAVQRLGMSDHGPVHLQIVANIALRLLRLLVEHNVQPNVVTDYNLPIEDAEVIVAMASIFHDLGISVHRADHEFYSLFLACPKIKELLEEIYDIPTRTILVSEVLHAIISHRAEGRPLTLEAGIVRVADALDMAEGRSRIPFQEGLVNIHSVSASAIEKIRIEKGELKPVRIVVWMNNSAGIFQIDELLKHKLRGSGLENYVEVEAMIEGETEKKLIHKFRI
ncbi:MAG: HD domain-containing protein [Thermodesulfobacteriota bacterium]